ncbi:ABC transporter permease [Methylosinus sp. LW4]|uniref:ABC transporter permease n=1 Tax=Methylosinus sp. LW4 TaxID=136993 RepID=UPI001FDA1C9B|nr:ABC transporter permease [Methylosinus sp. LW4]
MNGGEIILADEPTGALDSRNGREVMDLLIELNRRGHTLIIATHDPSVAEHARRIVELADGRIVSDRPTERDLRRRDPNAVLADVQDAEDGHPADKGGAALWTRLAEAALMAVTALVSHRLRTALTLLGVVIGIVSVVTMVAVGEAAQRFLAEELRGFMTNTLEIYPGRDWGDPDQKRIQTLNGGDVAALRRQEYVMAVSPLIEQTALLRLGSVRGSATVSGVGAGYFEMMRLPIERGAAFRASDIERQSQVVVIDANVRQRFFAGVDPIGSILFVGRLPCIVIGVAGRNYRQEARGGGARLNIWIPQTTMTARFVGRDYFDSIVVALREGATPKPAEERLTPFLTERHKTKDFMVFNLADEIKSNVALYEAMSLLLAVIGGVSLTIGGVGVMNIMLVSVAERAREIGVRMAVGASQADIRRQFLIEAVLICLIGGALGIVLSNVVCEIAAFFLPPRWEIRLSLSAMAAALVSATLTGVIFGYAPARNAARLDPVEALARD